MTGALIYSGSVLQNPFAVYFVILRAGNETTGNRLHGETPQMCDHKDSLSSVSLAVVVLFVCSSFIV